jgi:hypothetical protein
MGNAPQAGGALREATVGENVLLSVPHTPVTTDEPRCLAGSRFRPWHYILAIRIDTVFRDEGEEGFRSEGYDDEQVARTNAADYDDGGYGTAGVWDNWAGGWLVEPDWADEVEMVAEGWSRYDLRPTTSDEAAGGGRDG